MRWSLDTCLYAASRDFSAGQINRRDDHEEGEGEENKEYAMDKEMT